MTEDLKALFERQTARFEREAAKYTPLESATDDAELEQERSDEQIAGLVKQMDDAYGPGVGSRFFAYFSGPLPDDGLEALEHIPDGFPATREEFVESHEIWRQRFGDQRKTRN